MKKDNNSFPLCGECTIGLIDQNGQSFWYVEKYCKKCFSQLKKNKSWQLLFLSINMDSNNT